MASSLRSIWLWIASGRVASPEGLPNREMVPFALMHSTQLLNTTPAPVPSMAASASFPWFLLRISSDTLVVRELMASNPFSMANSTLSCAISTNKGVAPNNFTQRAAIMPIGPAPKMTTYWPACTSALRTACCATQAGSVIASSSMDAFFATISCHLDGSRQYSANPPSLLDPR